MKKLGLLLYFLFPCCENTDFSPEKDFVSEVDLFCLPKATQDCVFQWDFPFVNWSESFIFKRENLYGGGYASLCDSLRKIDFKELLLHQDYSKKEIKRSSERMLEFDQELQESVSLGRKFSIRISFLTNAVLQIQVTKLLGNHITEDCFDLVFCDVKSNKKSMVFRERNPPFRGFFFSGVRYVILTENALFFLRERNDQFHLNKVIYVHVEEDFFRVDLSDIDRSRCFFRGFTATRRKGKWGIINQDGGVVIEHKWDDIGFFWQDAVKVKLGERWGYVDEEGEVLVELRWDWIDRFYQKFARVELDGKYGYVDREGEVIVEPKWDWCEIFIKGFAQVCLEEKWGLIDEEGRVIVEPKWDSLGQFCAGLAKVEREGQVGYIDTTGEVVSWGEERPDVVEVEEE